MNAQEQRQIAVFESYKGLRNVEHSWLSAIRLLRTLGVSLYDAKQAHDWYKRTYETPPVACDSCQTEVAPDEGRTMTIQTCQQTHWSPAEYEEQFICYSCIGKAEEYEDFLRAGGSAD